MTLTTRSLQAGIGAVRRKLEAEHGTLTELDGKSGPELIKQRRAKYLAMGRGL